MGQSIFDRWLVPIFGSRNERLVKTYMQVAQAAGPFEAAVQGLSDEQLKAKTAEFKAALASGRRPEEILTEAFATVREAARRTIGLRHFDVQLVGGNVLYDGKIAEMATGEGKTLVATLAAYLVHLTGRHVHIVTVNDYLAKRDADWMGPVYQSLGLSVGAIQADMDTYGPVRKGQYDCDITYGTNNEYGFDYLRDNMKMSLEQMVQGPLDYAIIDEVDSILIDEARTPLIISGPAHDDITRYKKADAVCRELIRKQSGRTAAQRRMDEAERTAANAEGELGEAKKAKDADRMQAAQLVIERSERELAELRASITTMTEYFEVEYDRKAAHLTHDGIGAAQDAAGVGSFFTGSNMDWPHLLEQALRAHVVFEKEKDYVVMDGKVIIVDEFTGRLMHGRQWSDGLHQAVEAKEGVQIKEETQTLATITLQNFFKLYQALAGMTGTALTEAEEFMKIYNLDVVVIPTNRPCTRKDQDDLVYRTLREKFAAIVEEINEVSGKGRPILVGTASIEKSEAISQVLTQKYGVEHEVLNAKQHAREALIVEKAGHQHTDRLGRTRGNVTIATNMAGRGTDIKLGPGVAEIGGLHVLGTERHEARRIDNQLRGRGGRQGDAGSSIFFVSFDDDLLKMFAPDWVVKWMRLIGWEEGQPIQHSKISKGIERAQKKVEERNFDARKSLLDYDEVMDYQRKIFYSRRRKVLGGRGIKPLIEDMINSMLDGSCKNFLDEQYPYKCITEWAKTNFGIELDRRKIEGLEPQEIEWTIREQGRKEVSGDIPVTMGEYLEDLEDPKSWDLEGLAKWVMSAFGAGISTSKLRGLTVEEIEAVITEAAREQIDKRDCSPLRTIVQEGFGLRTLVQWANSKFDLRLEPEVLTGLRAEEIRQRLRKEVDGKYDQREIEYPVEFAMSMAYGPQGVSIYGFQGLADWANKRFRTSWTAEQIQDRTPQAVYNDLLELSRKYHEGYLEEEVAEKIKDSKSVDDVVVWANRYFGANLSADALAEEGHIQETILAAGKEFFRRELSSLERYVLLQIFDSTWKDHLYAMDHLKDSIFLRSFAEKDPKTEYKHEGFRMFEEMLETTEDRVTNIIFRVRLEAGAQARNVWNIGRTQKDEVGQFAMAERQRAAATAPQGEQKVKTIRTEEPKVGRNDPCPCGSGKKYKKCHGVDK